MTHPTHPSLPPTIDWAQVNRYIQNGDYNHALNLMQSPQPTHSETVPDGVDWSQTAPLLITQLCHICQQYQEAADWHHQNHLAAKAHERQIRQQMLAMLEDFSLHPPSHLPSILPSKPLGLLARIKRWLRRQGWYRTHPVSQRKRTLNQTSVNLDLGPNQYQSAGDIVLTPQLNAAVNSDRFINESDVSYETTASDQNNSSHNADKLSTGTMLSNVDTSDIDSANGSKSLGDLSKPNDRSFVQQRVLGEPYGLYIYALGSFRVYQGEHLIEGWQGLKGQTIFKYMVTQRNRPVSKERLMALFWPDTDLEAARRNLHQAIYSLRQTLRRYQPEIQYVLYEQDHYSLNPQVPIWLDVDAFEEEVQISRTLISGNQLTEALTALRNAESLYLGDFLEEDLAEEWTIRPRDRLRNLYLATASQLSDQYLAATDTSAAIALYNKILSTDPCDESAHRGLMRCYVAQNQRHLALRQYQTCCRILEEQLGVQPTPETLALFDQVVVSSL